MKSKLKCGTTSSQRAIAQCANVSATTIGRALDYYESQETVFGGNEEFINAMKKYKDTYGRLPCTEEEREKRSKRHGKCSVVPPTKIKSKPINEANNTISVRPGDLQFIHCNVTIYVSK